MVLFVIITFIAWINNIRSFFKPKISGKLYIKKKYEISEEEAVALVALSGPDFFGPV